MAQENYITKMAEYTKASSKMISNMDRALTNGLMVKYTKVAGQMVSSMEKVNLSILKARSK